MGKSIAIYNKSEINLKGRRFPEKLNLLSFQTNGIFFPSKIIEHGFKSVDIKITLDNDKPFDTQSNVKIIEQCLRLGKYAAKNMDLIEEYAIYYRLYKTEANKHYIAEARLDNNITSPPFIISENYNYIDIGKINGYDINKIKKHDNDKANENGTDKIDNNYEPKLISKQNISRSVAKWLNVCGIAEADYNNIINYGYISIELFLHILDICLEIYQKYQDYKEHGKLEADFNQECHICCNNERAIITRKFKNIKDFCLFLFPYILSENINNIRTCEYCGDLFIGRKNKKCCSNYCKDKKNNKYQKRKEREKIKRDSKYRQEQI